MVKRLVFSGRRTICSTCCVFGYVEGATQCERMWGEGRVGRLSVAWLGDDDPHFQIYPASFALFRPARSARGDLIIGANTSAKFGAHFFHNCRRAPPFSQHKHWWWGNLQTKPNLQEQRGPARVPTIQPKLLVRPGRPRFTIAASPAFSGGCGSRSALAKSPASSSSIVRTAAWCRLGLGR
jgi:hypothetical protein